MSTFRRSVLVAAAVLASAAGPASPVAAHPFGAPQTVAVSLDAADPAVVHIRWKVGGTDDLTLLGVRLGVLPADRVMLDGAVFYRPADAAAIGPSGQFADYLLHRITVTSGRSACAGRVEPPSDLAAAGVTVDFTCAAAVGVATVGVRMLTDLHPAYQTMASGPGGARAVYATGHESHDWTLGSSPSAASSARAAAVQLGAIVLAALLLGAGAFLVVRRRKRAAG
ncbi:hypothetical protein [Hamadaea tsunoensis]|uniref:hypothetical protein n=1 Tax=Hamadaea tsunoensis TaxID=53368 RepID=UPI0003F7C5F4|nr:hypothetical protein [Hamadaea tsunoensis]